MSLLLRIFWINQSKRQIHHNKDWNLSNPTRNFVWLKCQKDKSIITRIETRIQRIHKYFKGNCQKDKSIITRIETNDYNNLDTKRNTSKRQIHHNKDWNKVASEKNRLPVKSKRQIHHNKDWNVCHNHNELLSCLSKRQIHHNKDWNSGRPFFSYLLAGQKDKSIITRIETRLCK